MKKLFLAGFLLLISTAAVAQSISVFHLDKLPVQDTLLSGWKFHAGDNPQWVKPRFNDKDWQNIDPGEDVKEFQRQTHSGIGWIRLHIKADSSLTKRQLVVWAYQFTASEIYLNGELIKKYGSISRNSSRTVAFSPDEELLNLKLQPGVDQVIAVRLAYQSGIPYVTVNFVPLPAFNMYLNTYSSASVNLRVSQTNVKLSLINFSILIGIFFMLCIIHLLYFVFYRSEKVNLYYFIYSALLWLGSIDAVWYYDNIEKLTTQMWVVFSVSVSFILIFLFLTLTVYALFNYPQRLVFKALISIGVAAVIYQFWSEVVAYMICTSIFSLLCMLEAARICLWAYKRQKKDALLVFAGLFLCIGFAAWSMFLDQTAVFTMVLFSLSFIFFPIGMSVYLGIQSALTNQKLISTLVEVQSLSKQNLAKEQEKQQILANQNELLEEQVTERTSELNQSLTHLKATQNQLIQSEKMASLGELTAGIAHEIQNPLNFVNNFSEVNTELIGELEQEIDKGDLAEIKAIALDIKENEKKINMHGKRADGIVKGMLQHSKSGSGAKEPTNINALADEYMRLAYHGLRAKDKTFNAEMVTHFDQKLPQINVIPQDIGRVMLNLFNNAFYAVLQKQKTAGEEYKAEVSVTTFSGDSHVVIKIRDNGVGIPDAIKDKIMQPFFTTKPTGEGTGLGLSLTYDMVVKGHGGSIDVNTKEGEYTEFVIRIPIINH